MLFSCLVDADYIDTEVFMNEETVRDSGDSISILYEKFEGSISNWFNNNNINTINGRRTEILKYCIKMADAPKGLFKLTVPTGGGKTISSLGFALRDRKSVV